MKRKLIDSGFEIKFISSFVYTLFLFMYISRFFKKSKPKKVTDEIILNEMKLNPIINFIFGIFMKIDELLIKFNISLPIGGFINYSSAKKINL